MTSPQLANTDSRESERPAHPDPVPPDPWGEAVARFLADLLNNVEVHVHTDTASTPACNDHRVPEHPQLGADDRTRQFSLRTNVAASSDIRPRGFPPELSDLPEAALRALTRLTSATSTADLGYPSITRALHDIVIAEVIADRLQGRSDPTIDLDTIVTTVATTLDYFTELASTRLEGTPVTHGIVIAGDTLGLEPADPAITYPGRLSTRKRTPLLFDGTQSALVIDTSGNTLGGVERDTLPGSSSAPAGLEAFDELPGLDGALTAAASASFRGVGIYLRSDQSTWIFDDGALLFVRRGTRWKSIAFESFTHAITNLGNTSPDIGQRIARAALRLSIQGHGAILAVAQNTAALDTVVQLGDRSLTTTPSTATSVDDDLHRLLRLHAIQSSGGLARLARLDGATIIDTTGNVLAYGAIVRNTHSRGEGARTAAARALSTVTNLALSVSHDGPITIYHHGDAIVEIL